MAFWLGEVKNAQIRSLAYYFYLALVPKLEATTGSWEAIGAVIAPRKPWCRERRLRGAGPLLPPLPYLCWAVKAAYKL